MQTYVYLKYNGTKLKESIPGAPGGLRISYATLGAYMKYPKASFIALLPMWPIKIWLLSVRKKLL